VSSRTASLPAVTSATGCVRRSQDQRSRATRERILSATLACILDHSLRDTSTVLVSRRAGVSRGAMLHHFPTKQDLLHEALRDLLAREVTHMQCLADEVAADLIDFETLIDRIWAQFSGPLYLISLEFVNAARTDPSMRAILLDLGSDFNTAYADIWENLVSARLGDVTPRRRVAFTATLCLVRGMATQSIWRDDPDVFTELVAFWKQALRDLSITASSATEPSAA